MNKKTFFLASMIALALLAGCTTTDSVDETPASEVLNFNYNINPTSIRQGDLSVITMTLTNFYVNPLTEVSVRFEPVFSGITFSINGPDTIVPGSNGTWIIDVETAPGVIPKDYTFRPIICFKYSQEKIGFLRVAPNEPSTRNVDYSVSTTGPISIEFNNLRGINALSDYNSLDMTITYDFADNYNGLTPNLDLDTQTLSNGVFEIYSNDLSLRALQGSARIEPTSIIAETNTCRKSVISELSRCAFTHSDSTRVFANTQFGFRINVAEDLASELETYFRHELNYTMCLKPVSDFLLTVVRAQ
ncbi:MAG: hypothetical protein PHG04_00885 [Candidatus Nanoarchaeia archaeon]|nr:hypothetical protein [Candidatus Nanoarchaeia archaeon]